MQSVDRIFERLNRINPAVTVVVITVIGTIALVALAQDHYLLQLVGWAVIVLPCAALLFAAIRAAIETMNGHR